MKLSEEFPSKYYAKEDLEGGSETLTIYGAGTQTWDDGEKSVVLSFRETEKTLTLNKTKRGQVREAWGDDSAGWVGQRIEISHDPNVRYGNKIVGGIALRCLEGEAVDARSGPADHPDADIQF